MTALLCDVVRPAGHSWTAAQIREDYLRQLRARYRSLRRLERTYPTLPGRAWRTAIVTVAERIKSMPDPELAATRGTFLALRNMLARQMDRHEHDGVAGQLGGDVVLDTLWE